MRSKPHPESFLVVSSFKDKKKFVENLLFKLFKNIIKDITTPFKTSNTKYIFSISSKSVFYFIQAMIFLIFISLLLVYLALILEKSYNSFYL